LLQEAGKPWANGHLVGQILKGKDSQMKVSLLSDLHLEARAYDARREVLDSDVIILAGDICPGMRGIEWAISLLHRTKAHIIYIAGNHEFYGHDIHHLRKSMREYCTPPKEWIFEEHHRLHFLDDDEVIINGVRFLGATLWTNFLLYGEENKKNCMIDGAKYLNDFRLIRNGEWNFSPEDSIQVHNKSVAWLEQKLKHEPFDGTTVVVSHHAPSFRSVVPRFADDQLSACFASNLDHMFGFSSYWFHGHMHDSLDYEFNGTRVVCNPRGYARYEQTQENAHFNHALVVEIN